MRIIIKAIGGGVQGQQIVYILMYLFSKFLLVSAPSYTGLENLSKVAQNVPIYEEGRVIFFGII